jgi:outer membrane lipoprotein-sorting protein
MLRLTSTRAALQRTAVAALTVVILTLATLAPAGALGADDDADPWSALEQLRSSLRASSPLTARFVQTFTAVGFEGGDEESGELAIALPECLRWDYGEPFPKSFLLCNDTAYYWNPGEPSGHRYPIEEQEAPGLDFFLLSTEDLRQRYQAQARRGVGGLLHVDLDPLEPSPEVVALHVIVDTERERLAELNYEDADGNRTRFELFDYMAGAEASLFEPPAGVTWEEP